MQAKCDLLGVCIRRQCLWDNSFFFFLSIQREINPSFSAAALQLTAGAATFPHFGKGGIKVEL